MSEPVLSVRNLSVGFSKSGLSFDVVRGVNFDLFPGETLCIVGESGSGKSITAKAIMQICAPGKITGGRVELRGKDGTMTDIAALADDSAEIRAVRGGRIAMVFQEPMSSLSPVHRIGEQIIEAIQLHRPMPAKAAREAAIEALRRVAIPNPESAVDKYPFEFSGGMRQRAMIAMALSCEPDILIADEPTTALDVTTQAEILRLLKKLQDETGMAVMFITHDMGVVAEIADRVAVMYRGELIEVADVGTIFTTPKEPYSRHLIEASSRFSIEGDHPRGGTLPAPAPKPLLEIEGLNLTYRKSEGFIFRKQTVFHALHDINLTVYEGENLGVVGESGSGKTTLVKALMGLARADSGRADYHTRDGRVVNLLEPDALRRHRLNVEIRMVFQDPFSSLNPRMTVEQIIAEPLRTLTPMTGAERRAKVISLLERVGLPGDVLSRYPHAFSGGQRQRICIARALAVDPRLIVADEATSALDGSIRSQVLDLMFELQTELGLSYIFVGHDLGVVRYFCDRIAVMERGRLVEVDTATNICQRPTQPYTQRLIGAVPSPDPAARRLL